MQLHRPRSEAGGYAVTKGASGGQGHTQHCLLLSPSAKSPLGTRNCTMPCTLRRAVRPFRNPFCDFLFWVPLRDSRARRIVLVERRTMRNGRIARARLAEGEPRLGIDVCPAPGALPLYPQRGTPSPCTPNAAAPRPRPPTPGDCVPRPPVIGCSLCSPGGCGLCHFALKGMIFVYVGVVPPSALLRRKGRPSVSRRKAGRIACNPIKTERRNLFHV